MDKLIKNLVIGGAMVTAYVAGAVMYNQRTFDEDNKINTSFVTIPASDDKPDIFIPTNDYKQGYTDGCLDTLDFWSDTDPDSHMNFFAIKTGKNKYQMRSTEDRKQTPLEKFLDNPDKPQSRSYFKIPPISQ